MPRHRSIQLRVCELCGTEFWFQPSPSKVKKNGGRYCSISCRNLSLVVPLEDRFFNRVGKKTATGCILWAGARDGDGYGNIGGANSGPMRGAHRVAYELMVGPIPKGLHVLHRCDNPPCINPVHLFVGTDRDNTDDKIAKNRQGATRGEGSHLAKLTAGQVIEIRHRYQGKKDEYRQLAAEYRITPENVYAIIKRKTWRHV